MMYCVACKHLTDGSTCSHCGSEELRRPQPRDYCFLTQQEQIWAGLLEDVLFQNDIRALTRSHVGAGMMAAAGLADVVDFYVLYAQYDEAQMLEEGLFSGNYALDLDMG